MNDLDKFFKSLDFMNPTAYLSLCCSAKPYGELFMMYGRCSDCMKMSEFIKPQ